MKSIDEGNYTRQQELGKINGQTATNQQCRTGQSVGTPSFAALEGPISLNSLEFGRRISGVQTASTRCPQPFRRIRRYHQRFAAQVCR